MFFSQSGKAPVLATINGTGIRVLPDETLLNAALREGIAFPNSCRVGGCASCKCRLSGGQVLELTESAYILSDEEVKDGYILACQSIPRSDVHIDVELDRHTVPSTVSGTVIAQDRLTHDIVRLRVQLETALPYMAGQSAQISIASLPGISRSYSFATPVQQDRQVSFFVRKVPNGVFSSLINDQDVLGQAVQISDIAGTFWLRRSKAPLLLVAGGSGLAPILALLKAAVSEPDPTNRGRNITLLFGAREQKDLYCLDEIEQIKSQWLGVFRFVPVLSESTAADGWQGQRGLVTERIPALLESGTHAYLCGPPAMIDRAVDILQQQGVAHGSIHTDRFITRTETRTKPVQAIPGAPDSGVSAGILDYLKYFMFHLVGLLSVAAILAGGNYVTAGLLAVVVFYIVGDAVMGDDVSTPVFSHPRVLTTQLWLALPLLALIAFSAVWSVSAGDPFGFGHRVSELTGYDVMAARNPLASFNTLSTVILTGLMIGLVGTITGHELTHRTWDTISMFIGRSLLAFSFDTSFAIEHVYGHHRYVATEHDPATAPRGRHVYHHAVASTIKGNISAWKIEARRLKLKGYALISMHNAVLRGYLMSVVLVMAAWAVGGSRGALFFIISALFGKFLLEVVNYMEHYGIVRDPATAVQPRHSWNTNRRISSWTLFNLTRHSHHHAQGEVPFHELKPYPEAPMMVNGYLTTILIAMIPPLWHYLMTPKVFDWDQYHASGEERLLVGRANEKSAMKVFQRAARTSDIGP